MSPMGQIQSRPQLKWWSYRAQILELAAEQRVESRFSYKTTLSFLFFRET